MGKGPLSAALIGTQLYGGVMDSSLLWVPAQWLASMVVALVLGLLCTRLIQGIVLNSSVHLLLKLSRLGSVMSVAVALLLVAVGMNLSGLFSIARQGAETSLPEELLLCLAVLALLALLSPALKASVSALSEQVFDTDAAISLSCVLASALTMLLFARGTIVSPSVVMLCALAGARNFRGKDIAFSTIVAPLFSALASFTIAAVHCLRCCFARESPVLRLRTAVTMRVTEDSMS